MPRIELPWSAWYHDTVHTLQFPATWQTEILHPRGAESWAPEELAHALAAPIDCPPLSELARGCRSACVVIDDIARPTPTADILPGLIEQLRHDGLPDEQIVIVVAVGSHRPLTNEELTWKVGASLRHRHRVECHDAWGQLTPTGIRYGSHELQINTTFAAAELKIVVGSVLPHPFAGYSGGAKLVLPGLADIQSIRRSHQFVQLGLRGGGDPNANQFRLETEEIARRLGLRFAVCVVPGPYRQTWGLYCGDLVAAHRRACQQAARVYATEIAQTYDGALVNAYPKDLDLIQAEGAFVGWKSARSPVVREGGVIVLTCAAPCGRGQHGLFAPGGLNYHPPRPQRWLGQRELWVYCPSVTRAQVQELYWDGYPSFHEASVLEQALAQRLPPHARLAVFPCGPLQQVCDLRNA